MSTPPPAGDGADGTPRIGPPVDPRWRRVQALFLDVLALDPAARDAALAAACDGDEALFEEVRTLLACADEASTFFEGPSGFATLLLGVASGGGLAGGGADALGAGASVGPYRLIREAGRGGMGTVYLAERADGAFEKRVAVKIVRRGLDTDDVLARFRRERRVLAGLDHPNVAHLLDGGVTDDGRPYLVMEFVEGEPITDYADRRGLGVAARLRLFVQVCDAVAFAHGRLVVHRDLKPSNLLVTDDAAGRPRVKLLDFGIAKLLEGDGDDEAVVTRTGLRVHTPAYAAPEQVRGEAVTTATDVYGLGVVLYELLTGRRPFGGTGTSAAAVERAVLEAEPARPSAAVAVEEAEPAERLRRRLRGDLDAIVLAALRKEPARRYASAGALADDVRRYLGGLPVQAQPDTAAYRARKFVRRHAWGVAGAAAFVLLLVGFTLVTAAQSARIGRQAEAVARERDRAERVATFLTDLFEGASPDVAQGEPLSVRALLDRGAARLEADLAGEPTVQAQLMEVVGDVYRKLGHFPEAGRLLERAVAVRRAAGADDAELAEALNRLAYLAYFQGDNDRAWTLADEALAIQRRRLGPDHPATAETMHNVGYLLREAGRPAEAEPLLRAALAVQRAQPGADGPAAEPVVRTLLTLGMATSERGDEPGAEALYREALALARVALGPRHPLTLQALNNLAVAFSGQGRNADAIPLLREVLDAQRRALTDEHVDVALTKANLGSTLVEVGATDEAERLLRAALATFARVGAGDYAGVPAAKAHLAALLHRRGADAEAEALLREALRQFEANGLGASTPATRARTVLATLLCARAATAEAEALRGQTCEAQSNSAR